MSCLWQESFGVEEEQMRTVDCFEACFQRWQEVLQCRDLLILMGQYSSWCRLRILASTSSGQTLHHWDSTAQQVDMDLPVVLSWTANEETLVSCVAQAVEDMGCSSPYPWTLVVDFCRAPSPFRRTAFQAPSSLPSAARCLIRSPSTRADRLHLPLFVSEHVYAAGI